MSGGDTDNHMYGTLDIVSAWSLSLWANAIILTILNKFNTIQNMSVLEG